MIIDPNAILSGRKNYKKGIVTRSRIIRYMRSNYIVTSNELVKELNISHSAVYYHLHLLNKYGLVKREGKKWRLISYPQHTLTEYMGEVTIL